MTKISGRDDRHFSSTKGSLAEVFHKRTFMRQFVLQMVDRKLLFVHGLRFAELLGIGGSSAATGVEPNSGRIRTWTSEVGTDIRLFAVGGVRGGQEWPVNGP